MFVYLFLNDKIRELSGFKSQPYPDGSGDQMIFNGMHMFVEKGRIRLMWDIEVDIPDELKDLVEEVSYYETIPRMGNREPGIYRHESAECELIPDDNGSAKREKLVYQLKFKAKKLEDIRVLMHKVKTGTIRPDESYAGPQSGKTRQELENELLQTRRQLGEVLTTNEKLEKFKTLFERECKYSLHTHQRFSNLADTIKKRWFFPLISRPAIVDEIECILLAGEKERSVLLIEE